MSDKFDPIGLIKEELTSIADRDGVITEEEQKLIDSIINEIEKYNALMQQAIADNKITPKEKNNLFRAKIQIIKNAVSAIREDFKVTEDEQQIINGLQKMLPEISKFEKQF